MPLGARTLQGNVICAHKDTTILLVMNFKLLSFDVLTILWRSFKGSMSTLKLTCIYIYVCHFSLHSLLMAIQKVYKNYIIFGCTYIYCMVKNFGKMVLLKHWRKNFSKSKACLHIFEVAIVLAAGCTYPELLFW